MDKDKTKKDPQMQFLLQMFTHTAWAREDSRAADFRAEYVGMRKQQTYKTNDKGERVALSTREILEDLKEQLQREQTSGAPEQHETEQHETEQK